MPATSRLHLTAGLLALGLALAACGSDPQQDPASTADASSSTVRESRDESGDARETDEGSASDQVSDPSEEESTSSGSETADDSAGSSDAASSDQDRTGSITTTDGTDGDDDRSDDASATDADRSSDDSSPASSAADTASADAAASDAADDDRSETASSDDDDVSTDESSHAASRDSSDTAPDTARPADDAEETSASPSREASTHARSTSTHAPVTVAADELPAERDLGGSQAGVAKDDTPVKVVNPAPAPPVVKVEEEHIAPADPVVVTPAPAPSSPSTSGPASGSASSSDPATSSAPSPGSPSSDPSSSGPSTSDPSSSTPPSSAPASSSTPSTSAAPTPPTAPSTAPHATPVPTGPVDCRVKRCIALTFDDGPGQHTGRLLDVLAAEGVPATFYVVGRSADINPGLISRMGAEGHQVGNHSWDHPNLTTLTDDAVAEQIRRADAAIRDAGVRPSTVRAPYGALNESVLDTLGGLPSAGSVTWTVDTRDWQHRTPSMTLDAVKQAAAPGGIVLLHDIHSTTVDAVPSVIAWLRSEGYTFVTVDTLTGGVASGTTVNHGLRP